MPKRIYDLIEKNFSDDPLFEQFSQRAGEGKLSADNNPISHFCVYFVAYDPVIREIFIGHHKNSGLWLVNGGHLDAGETPLAAVMREVGEEWGIDAEKLDLTDPELITITPINNPPKQLCREHYDVWYFVPVDKEAFSPDPVLLAQEFYENRWMTYEEAKKLSSFDPGHTKAIELLEKKSGSHQ